VASYHRVPPLGRAPKLVDLSRRALATFLLNRPVVGFVFSRGGLHVSSHASTRDAGIALVSSCSQTPFGNTGPRNSVSAKRHRRTAPSNDAGCRDSLAWSRLRPCRANGEVAARGGETEFRGPAFPNGVWERGERGEKVPQRSSLSDAPRCSRMKDIPHHGADGGAG